MQQEQTHKFMAPSGYTYIIREQNGADEDTLSNVSAVKESMNLTNFIASIVVSTDFTLSGKLSPDEALDLPVLDRYAILLHSRIFSLGEELEFVYFWDNKRPLNYSQDLTELLYNSYEHEPTEEEKKAKPNALPLYPDREVLKAIKYKGYEVTLSTGKHIKFNFLDGHAERYSATLPEDKQSRNSDLLARGLELEVDGKWEKVHNFSLFRAKEMAELRKAINNLDPIWIGLTEVEDPETGAVENISVFTTPRFFYPAEA